MAVAKPSTTKKKAAPKKIAAKTTAKKAPIKKPVAKKSAAKSAKPAEVKSFRLSRESQKFISVRFTRQTVYWTIIAVALLIVGLMSLQAQINILQTLDEMSESVRQ